MNYRLVKSGYYMIRYTSKINYYAIKALFS